MVCSLIGLFEVFKYCFMLTNIFAGCKEGSKEEFIWIFDLATLN
jgi:hypothetical protein